MAACYTHPKAAMLNHTIFLLFLAAELPAPMQTAIDTAVKKTMSEAGVASVSIAIVKDAQIAYVRAYGDARLEPKTPATPGMRYKIASNSKQITATAILLLAEEGKLSVDDPVSRFLPDLTRANEVTIRELLSHTSGYQDYYPLDYVAPFMTQKASPQHIVDTWAKKPLDFDPGTQWQYSNTNYTIAGLIIEKITGKPVIEFLREHIFQALGMHSPIDVDAVPWSAADATGYVRYALGPSRVAPGEAQGWMYAAGELGMTASDLARWDISLINDTILKPASLKELTTEVHLKNGAGTGYALGLGVSNRNGHRKWAHGGGADGFISENFTLPDDKISVTVLTNQEDPAPHRIASDIESILIAPPPDPDAPAALARVRGIFTGLQNGKLDRSLLSDDGNAYFTAKVIADFRDSLKPLGTPAEFKQTSMSLRGGMVFRSFSIKAANKRLELTTFATPDGKLAQYMIYPAAN